MVINDVAINSREHASISPPGSLLVWRVPVDPSAPLPPPFETSIAHPRAVFVLKVVPSDSTATVWTASLDRRVRSSTVTLPPTPSAVKDLTVHVETRAASSLCVMFCSRTCVPALLLHTYVARAHTSHVDACP